MISLPFPCLSLFRSTRPAAETPVPVPATPISPLTGIDAEVAQLQAAAVRFADNAELLRLMTRALVDARAERVALIERDAWSVPFALSPLEQLLEDCR